MTPDDLIQQVGALVATNCDQEALALISKHLRALAPSMTSEQIVRVADLAHMAQVAIDLEEWDAANKRTEVASRASRAS